MSDPRRFPVFRGIFSPIFQPSSANCERRRTFHEFNCAACVQIGDVRFILQISLHNKLHGYIALSAIYGF